MKLHTTSLSLPWLLCGALALGAPAQVPAPQQDPAPREFPALDAAALARFELLLRTDGVDAALATVREAQKALREEPAPAAPEARARRLDMLTDLGAYEVTLLTRAGRHAEARALVAAAERATQTGDQGPLAELAPRLLATEAYLDVRRQDMRRGDSVYFYTPSELQAASAGSADAYVTGIVVDAMQRGDKATLERLGVTAIPAYEQILRDAVHPAALLATQPGPLHCLGMLAPERAIEIAKELAARPGAGWCAAVAMELGFTNRGPSLLGVAAQRDGAAVVPLLERLVASGELTEEVETTLGYWLAEGDAWAPVVERLLARAADRIEDNETLRGEQHLARQKRLLGSSEPAVRRMAAERMVRSRILAPEELRLLGADSDPGVRAQLPLALWATASRGLATDPAQWLRVIGDRDAGVRSAAYSALGKLLNQNLPCPLAYSDLFTLLRRFNDPLEMRLAGELVEGNRAPNLIAWLAQTEVPVAERAEAVLWLWHSSLPTLSALAPQLVDHAEDRYELAAELLRRIDWAAAPRNSFHDRLANTASNLPASARGALFAKLVVKPGFPRELDRVVLQGNGPFFQEVAPDLLAPMLLALVERDPALLQSSLYSLEWQRLESALQASLRPDLTLRQRVFCLAGLAAARPADTSAGQAVVDAVLAARGAGDEALTGLWELASIVLYGAEAQSLRVLTEALARPEFATPVFARYSAPGRGREADADAGGAALVRLVDLMEARAAALESGSAFPYLAARLAGEMRRSPTLYRPKLARAWQGPRGASRIDLAHAAHARGDTAFVDAARAAALAETAEAKQEWQVASAIDAVLGIPGDASARALAELSASTENPKLREAIVTRLSALVTARELAARLDVATSNEVARARAIAETAALLDDPNEAVRLEAIRGLATLGALEHLPRLVKLVGSGSAAERRAAQEALDLLHARAKAGQD